MSTVENVKKVQEKLRKLASERFISGREVNGSSVIVGYTANYALHVHEDLEAQHKPGKQAKYLEEPARRLAKELGNIVYRAVKSGKATLLQALYLAGLRLQRESQEIVPIDTGNLRGSAFTRKEQ